MTANINPIYSIQPHIESSSGNNAGLVVGPTAATAQDGSGATGIYQIFQAGANGSYVQKLRLMPVVSPAATVARIFINNTIGNGAWVMGTTNTTTTTWLHHEITLPQVAVSQTSQGAIIDVVLNLALPGGVNGGYRLAITFGTSTGSAGNGWTVTVVAGDY